MMSDLSMRKLEEKMVLFLLVISENKDRVNRNTFLRYIYIYYLTASFLDPAMRIDPINILIEKGDVTIVGFDNVLNDLRIRCFIDFEGSDLLIKPTLLESLRPFIQEKGGALYAQYIEIKPFVSLLQSYNDQFVFTIFFNEPTFNSASLRGITQLRSSNSVLKRLLGKFKGKIQNSRIDEYDVLAYWMDFILKNYYLESENEDEED